jgi:hypothetical protein
MSTIKDTRKKLAWRTCVTPSYKNEITTFHRPLWAERRSVGVEDKHLEWSLRSLVSQDYSVTDIGIMFGVSRERVRQWCRKYSIRPRFYGTRPRIWDNALGRFRGRARSELEGDLHKRIRSREKLEAHHRRFKLRQKDKQTLMSLAIKLGRSPSTKELTAALGYPWHGLTYRWGWAYGGNGRCTQAQALHRLYRTCGLQVRAVGKPGWIKL